LRALRQLVSNQESEIKRLRCKLDYVLSFLGLTEMVAESNNEGPTSLAKTNAKEQLLTDIATIRADLALIVETWFTIDLSLDG
jgi:hypothetical protein